MYRIPDSGIYWGGKSYLSGELATEVQEDGCASLSSTLGGEGTIRSVVSYGGGKSAGRIPTSG